MTKGTCLARLTFILLSLVLRLPEGYEGPAVRSGYPILRVFCLWIAGLSFALPGMILVPGLALRPTRR